MVREDQIFEEELIKMFDEADDDDGDDNKLYYADTFAHESTPLRQPMHTRTANLCNPLP